MTATRQNLVLLSLLCCLGSRSARATEALALTSPTQLRPPVSPMAALGRRLELGLQEVRCALPDARLLGDLARPGAEVCLSPDGAIRICLGARVSLRGDWAATTGSVFVTDRPGLCPHRSP